MKRGSAVFTKEDRVQIREKGLTPDDVLSQVQAFEKGFPFLTLDRPCTVGDGITVFTEKQLGQYPALYERARLSGRAMKFVPASGAASRMFKVFLAFSRGSEEILEKEAAARAEQGDADARTLLRFMCGIRDFAFYEDLKTVMARDGLNTEEHIAAGTFKAILDYLLTEKGLDFANLPKGLIPFHRYGDRSRTPFEEHLVEAAEYVRDRQGRARVHFTVSPEHERDVRDHVASVWALYDGPGVNLEAAFSTQHPSTDTIAVDMENRPFRDDRGRLVFRPGGHGALIKNLNELDGAIVFIKNIDNVLPDSRKQGSYLYKNALAGLLVLIQERVFAHLEKLTSGDGDDLLLGEAAAFARDHFAVFPPQDMPRKKKIALLVSRLNRPLRVCGMVKNEGEPGGGPFWVRNKDGTLSRQIVESSQVNMNDPEQRSIWNASTHFNPVDLVCALKDHTGKSFDLKKFVDPNAAFISTKSMGGRELKALELPGLWNGGMAGWNTLFVEVPLFTFSPVKTLLDLLREEHQP
jgi:hypothetical protein